MKEAHQFRLEIAFPVVVVINYTAVIEIANARATDAAIVIEVENFEYK